MERKDKLTFFEKIFFIEIIQGLLLTLKYLRGKPITVQYPDEKRAPATKSRGIHTFKLDTDGSERCNACGICVKICPAQCMEVKGEKIDDKRVATVYNIDLTRCIFCGMCVDSCPKDAIAMVEAYEFSVYDKNELKLDKEKLHLNSGRVTT